jgi:hypothetical protein
LQRPFSLICTPNSTMHLRHGTRPRPANSQRGGIGMFLNIYPSGMWQVAASPMAIQVVLIYTTLVLPQSPKDRRQTTNGETKTERKRLLPLKRLASSFSSAERRALPRAPRLLRHAAPATPSCAPSAASRPPPLSSATPRGQRPRHRVPHRDLRRGGGQGGRECTRCGPCRSPRRGPRRKTTEGQRPSTYARSTMLHPRSFAGP